MNWNTCVTYAGISLAVMSAPLMAGADSVPFFGLVGGSTEGLGSYEGVAEYAHIGGNDGTLSITITNTSPADNGGYLTGFVFRILSVDQDALATLESTDYPSFDSCDDGSAPPYGSGFKGGAALNGNWTGGGDPSGGIPAGETGHFSFLVTSIDAQYLTAADFINGGSLPYGFVVRFRGFDDNGSDKVPAAASQCCTGDVDCDGDIDGRDLGFLLGAWGANLGSPADLNGDGEVNGLDLGLLLGAWGSCPSPN